MNYLEHLDLSFNHLRNLKKILGGLEHLRFLKTLSLEGNPCCEEPGYRIMVIQALPSLNVLDFKVVTDLERQVALAKQRRTTTVSSSSGAGRITGGDNAPTTTAASSTGASMGGADKAKPRLSCLERLQREAQQIRARQERAAAAAKQQQQQQHDATVSTGTAAAAGSHTQRQPGTDNDKAAPHRRAKTEYFTVRRGPYDNRHVVKEFC